MGSTTNQRPLDQKLPLRYKRAVVRLFFCVVVSCIFITWELPCTGGNAQVQQQCRFPFISMDFLNQRNVASFNGFVKSVCCVVVSMLECSSRAPHKKAESGYANGMCAEASQPGQATTMQRANMATLGDIPEQLNNVVIY